MLVGWGIVGEGSRTLGLIMRQLPHAMDQQFFDQLPKWNKKGFTNPHASMDQQFFDQQLPKWNKKDPRIVYTNFGPKIKTQNDVKWPRKIGTWFFCIGTRNPQDRDIVFFYRDMRFSAPLVQGTSLYKGFWKILVAASISYGAIPMAIPMAVPMGTLAASN